MGRASKRYAFFGRFARHIIAIMPIRASTTVILQLHDSAFFEHYTINTLNSAMQKSVMKCLPDVVGKYILNVRKK